MKKNFRVLSLVLALIFVFTACGNGENKDNPSTNSSETKSSVEDKSSGEVITFRLAENQPADNPISKAMEMFAELVSKKTDGSVKIDVYLDGQLGSETETIDQVEAGTLDIARVNTSSLSDTISDCSVFSLPYIFRNQEHKYKVLDGKIGEKILSEFSNNNMIGLRFWEAGSRNFYSTEKPINSVADIKGMKIRVQPNDVAIKMVESLGGAATPMDYGEVYQGLQTGVIQAAENDFVSYATSGHFEVAKYMCLDGHMSPPAVVIMSADSWNKLNEEQKKGIKEAADEACEWQRKAMNDFQLESRKKVEEAGCQINEVNVEEFAEAVQPVYDNYPDLKELIEEIQAVK